MVSLAMLSTSAPILSADFLHAMAAGHMEDFQIRDVKPFNKLDIKNFTFIWKPLMRGFRNGLIYLSVISGSRDIYI